MNDSYNDEAETWRYIGRWYKHLFNENERFGPSFLRLQELVPEASLSDIKAVLAEYHGGKRMSQPVVRKLQEVVDEFTRQTIDRIQREHRGDLFVNRCPACQRIVASPSAKQCLWCGHDWHSVTTNESNEARTPEKRRDAT